MKKLLLVVALFGLVASAVLSGCKKEENAPVMPSTNAPAAPAMPSTNAPAQ